MKRSRFIKLIRLSTISTITLIIWLAIPHTHSQDETIIIIEHSPASLGIAPQPDGSFCPPPKLPPMSINEFLSDPPIATGMGYGMMPEHISGVEANLGYFTYQINADVPTTATFHLYLLPETGYSVNLRYYVFLDEQQISAFDNETGIYYDITMNPGDRTSFEFHLPPLSPGIHEFIVLGESREELYPSGSVITFPFRVTLVVGDNPTFPTQAYNLLEPDSRRNFLNPGYINLSLSTERALTAWADGDVYKTVRDKLDFYAIGGYMENVGRLSEHGIEPQNSPFAIIALIDGEQVPITPSGDNVLYVAATPDNKYSYIPLTITSMGRQGESELLVLRINYPRFPKCWIWDNLEGYVFDDSVYSVRFGINFE